MALGLYWQHVDRSARNVSVRVTANCLRDLTMKMNPFRRPPRKRHLPARLTTGLAAAGTAAVLYRWALRPWQRTWGTTRAEARRPLPGDALVPRADYETTRAIGIDAPADAVWPWLVQLGQGRGGFYSYDWLENFFGLDIHSSDRIVSEWQEVDLGDPVRMAPPDQFDGTARMEIALIEPGRALVLRSPDEAPANQAASWAFVLDPVDEATTRLIVRTRMMTTPAMRLLLDPAHFIMERKMLRGIKQRAEREMIAAPSEE